jgi:hypothetical protein
VKLVKAINAKATVARAVVSITVSLISSIIDFVQIKNFKNNRSLLHSEEIENNIVNSGRDSSSHCNYRYGI